MQNCTVRVRQSDLSVWYRFYDSAVFSIPALQCPLLANSVHRVIDSLLALWKQKQKMGENKENKRLRAKLRCSASELKGNILFPINPGAEHLSFALSLLFSLTSPIFFFSPHSVTEVGIVFFFNLFFLPPSRSS